MNAKPLRRRFGLHARALQTLKKPCRHLSPGTRWLLSLPLGPARSISLLPHYLLRRHGIDILLHFNMNVHGVTRCRRR